MRERLYARELDPFKSVPIRSIRIQKKLICVFVAYALTQANSRSGWL